MLRFLAPTCEFTLCLPYDLDKVRVGFRVEVMEGAGWGGCPLS
jgi:hypothetical protein